MKQIRQEVLITAPAAKIWEHLANSGRLARWFMPNDFAPVVGHRFTLACEHGESVACVVKEVQPPTRLAYTFRAAGMSADTLVTFTLEETVSSTKLTLVHSGWERLPPGEAAAFNQTDQGWGSRFLPRLQALFERRP